MFACFLKWALVDGVIVCKMGIKLRKVLFVISFYGERLDGANPLYLYCLGCWEVCLFWAHSFKEAVLLPEVDR